MAVNIQKMGAEITDNKNNFESYMSALLIIIGVSITAIWQVSSEKLIILRKLEDFGMPGKERDMFHTCLHYVQFLSSA